jgi:hypothetical protein
VYFKNHVKENKLSSRWLPYYRIIEQTSPVNFMIKNQLTGKTTKAHAEQIRLASLEWEIPKQAHKPNQRNATMAVPVETDSDIKSSSESDDDTPLAKIAKRYRRFPNFSSKLGSDFSSLDCLLLILSLLSLLCKLDMDALV